MPANVNAMTAEAPGHALLRSSASDRQDCITCHVPTTSPPQDDTVAQAEAPPSAPPASPPPEPPPPASRPAPPPPHDSTIRAIPQNTQQGPRANIDLSSLRPIRSANDEHHD